MGSILNPYKAYTYFKNNFVLKKSSQGWYKFHCPFCDNGDEEWRCAVKFDFQLVKCWSAKCGYKDKMSNFIADLENFNYSQVKSYVSSLKASSVNLEIVDRIKSKRRLKVDLPHSYKSILEGDTMLGNRARAYLSGRGYDLNSLDRMGIGYCNEHHPDNHDLDYFGRIIIPIKYRGSLVYYLGRSFIGAEPKYKNPPSDAFNVGSTEVLFNEDALDFKSLVFITEGAFDAMEFRDYGVCTFTWSISDAQYFKMLRSKVKRFVMVPDVGFYHQAIKSMVPFMGHKEVYVLNMDLLSDHGKDVNEIGVDKVLDLYSKTDPLNFTTIVETVNNY